jgi:hypothetical protein
LGVLLTLFEGDCAVLEGEEAAAPEGEEKPRGEFIGGDCIVGNRRDGDSNPEYSGGEDPMEGIPKRGMMGVLE